MGAYDKVKRGAALDLGATKFRSSWERNVARWLNHRIALGEVTCWEFEPHTFVFSGISRGSVCYTPDFKITYPDGSVEWLEVKGWERSRDRTKWKRMASHYPSIKLVIMGADVYKSLQNSFGGLPHWER